MINKEVKCVLDAIEGVKSNMTFMVGGFGLCGIPENTIKALSESGCLLYTSPSPRDISGSRMPSSA